MNAHRGITLFAYQDDALIFYVPHGIDDLFPLVHEFLARSYSDCFFLCHAATVSESQLLANRFFEGYSVEVKMLDFSGRFDMIKMSITQELVPADRAISIYLDCRKTLPVVRPGATSCG